MELVYLWVEDYKNIKKQGFNFSPRFECKFYDEYDEKGNLKDNCKLEIKPKEHMENFFGDNINITAIVGKNGSGKSSLFESFDFLWKKVYYIYSEEGQLYSNYFKKDIYGRYIEKKDIVNNVNMIYMSKFFFMQRQKKTPLDFFYKEDLYVKKFKSKSLKSDELSSENFHKNILELLFRKKCLSLKFFKPNFFYIKFNLVNNKLELNNLNKKQLDVFKCFQCRYKIYLKSLELLKPYKVKLTEEENDNVMEKLKKFIENEEEKIHEYDYGYDEQSKYLDLPCSDTKIINFIQKIFPAQRKIITINDFYIKYLEDNSDNDFDASYYSIFYYLYKIGFLEYEIYDENKKFSSLSSGEKSLFSDFCLLHEKLQEEQKHKEINKENNNFIHRIIFLDEPDLTLHPEWQRQYIDSLVSVLKKYKDIDFHLIFTTHSPFLLSDLPKENIIFLENGKQIDGLEEKKQTFGANIHTLLSDSFFMEDGLMGEFAKSKIDRVIELLNQEHLNKKDLKYCEEIISIIGEPIIKNQLQRMLDSKRLKKVDKIDAIEKSIEALQKELERLKNDKNSK